MPVSARHPKVDAYFSKLKNWKKELESLREFLLSTPLTEDFKWYAPCYTYNGRNLVVIGPLKDCCVLSFFKGVLLKDPDNILSKPGSNTRSARTIRFNDIKQIKKVYPVLRTYINEAIELEVKGTKVSFTQKQHLVYPSELDAAFKNDKKFKAAFEALTPGRRRAYLLHFGSAKQSATISARILRSKDRILAGKGMTD